MSEFNLATADQAALKAHALNTYELKLPVNMLADNMRERIMKHCKENNLEPPMSELKTKHDKAAIKKGEDVKYFIVQIAKSDKPGGKEPVPVGVQGVLYTVPRGIDIKVSEGILEVLRNAITDVVTQDDDEEAEIHHDEVQTYPFSSRPFTESDAMAEANAA